MKSLLYSSYIVQEGFDMNQEIEKIEEEVSDVNAKIKMYKETNKHVKNNKEELSKTIKSVKENAFIDKDFTDIKEDKRLSQWISDSTSMIAQDKFILALGGIALTSLIILNTQL